MKKIYNLHDLFKVDLAVCAKLLKKKNFHFDEVFFANLKERKGKLTVEIQELKSELNKQSKKPPINEEDKVNRINLNRELKEKITAKEGELDTVENDFVEYFINIPNFPHDSVPYGEGEEDNLVIEKVLTPPQFDFPVKSHVELGEKYQNIDFESASALSGRRFVVLKNEIAQLHRALIQFMLNLHTSEGYEEHYLPYMVNGQALYGTGQLPKFKDDLFKIENKEDMFLIPTAEVPLTNLYAGKLLGEKDLPINMTAHTPCFRSEAGSYGKDIVGLIRQHQFEKVELVKICSPETSYQELENMREQSEKVLKLLELPFRRVALCGGDLGFSAAKTYDLEVWVPSQNTYREIASISNCEDFQARRMLTRYKDVNGNKKYVHTLNGSALAIGRCMIAIMENNQMEDGRIKIPEVLRGYFNGKQYLLEG